MKKTMNLILSLLLAQAPLINAFFKNPLATKHAQSTDLVKNVAQQALIKNQSAQEYASLIFNVLNNNTQPILLYNVVNGKVIKGFNGKLNLEGKLINPQENIQFVINPTAENVRFTLVTDQAQGKAYLFDNIKTGKNAKIIVAARPTGFFSSLFNRFRKSIKKEDFSASITQINVNSNQLKPYFSYVPKTGNLNTFDEVQNKKTSEINQIQGNSYNQDFVEQNYGKYGPDQAADALSTY